MKNHKSVLFLFPLLVALSAQTHGQANSSEPQNTEKVGRFQLFQGIYTVLDGKNNRSDKETNFFLIDTETGKVFRYTTRLDQNGKFFESWQPTNK